MNAKRRTRVHELQTYSTRVHKSRKRRTSVPELKTRSTELHQSREHQVRILTPGTCHSSTRSTQCADAIITPRDEDASDSLHRVDIMTSSLCSTLHTDFHALPKKFIST